MVQEDRVTEGHIDEIMKVLLGLSRIEQTNRGITEGVKVYVERAWINRVGN